MAQMRTCSSFSSTLPRLPHVPDISPTCPTSEVLPILILNLRVHFPVLPSSVAPSTVYRLPQRPNRDGPSLTQPRDMRNTQPLSVIAVIAKLPINQSID